MTSTTSPAPVHARHSAASRFFRDSDGHLTVWQLPNPAIAVWLAAVVVGLFPLSSAHETAVAGVRHGALIVWGLDEVVRGAGTFRRVLGAVVLVTQLFSLVLA